jgi:MYXO-CTERM domain-containing protein
MVGNPGEGSRAVWCWLRLPGLLFFGGGLKERFSFWDDGFTVDVWNAADWSDVSGEEIPSMEGKIVNFHGVGTRVGDDNEREVPQPAALGLLGLGALLVVVTKRRHEQECERRPR